MTGLTCLHDPFSWCTCYSQKGLCTLGHSSTAYSRVICQRERSRSRRRPSNLTNYSFTHTHSSARIHMELEKALFNIKCAHKKLPFHGRTQTQIHLSQRFAVKNYSRRHETAGAETFARWQSLNSWEQRLAIGTTGV